MTGNKDPGVTLLNPLTGESKATINYYFIDSYNRKINLKSDPEKDSTSVFPDQQELTANYLGSGNHFKILLHHKIYLVHKNGRQLSEGYENICQGPTEQFYITERDIKRYKEIKRAKGLIDSTGKTIIKCENKQIVINTIDSVIYCCSAVFGVKLSDDVFDFKGNVIYTSNDHIDFSTGKIHVCKRYEPKEVYTIVHSIKKNTYEIEGDTFYYLKQHKALIIHKKNWYLVDMDSFKKQKIDQDAYNRNIYSIFVF